MGKCILRAGCCVKIPWLRRIIGEGDDVSLELESDLGITKIQGVTALSTFRVGNPDIRRPQFATRWRALHLG